MNSPRRLLLFVLANAAIFASLGANAATPSEAQRCDSLPASQRQDCVSRIQGAGTASVQGGGILRELSSPAS